MTLRILHLFPRRMDINGDVGNVLALSRRSAWRGIPAEILGFEGGEFPSRVGLIVIGSGPLSAQRSVLADLLPVAGVLRALAEDGVPMLAVAGGWHVLGSELRTSDGERIPAAAVFPSHAQLDSSRRVGDQVVRGVRGDLTGFVNHAATTTLEGNAEALGRIIAGPETGGSEGLVSGSLIGTTLHGSVLPLNPSVADELLDAALARSGAHPTAEPDHAARERADDYARRARAAIGARAGLGRSAR